MNRRNSANKAWHSIKTEIDKKGNTSEAFDSVRESRMGYRSTGFYQLNRLFASEGVLTIGIGGPPIVGK